ncbi:MAG: V-type ATP synthase subunit I [Bacillota bacterium]
MRVLARLGTVEVTQSTEIDGTTTPNDIAHREEIAKKLARINFAFTFLKEIKRQEKHFNKEQPKGIKREVSLDLSKENKLITYDDLTDIVKDEFDIFTKVSAMEAINANMVEIKGEIARLQNSFQQISDYIGLDIPFSEIKDSSRITMIVGLIPLNKIDILESGLTEKATLQKYANDKTYMVAIIAPIDEKAELLKTLALCEFSRCGYDYKATPTALIKEIKNNISDAEERRNKAYLRGYALLTAASELKLLSDYYTIELAKQDIIDNGKETSRAFVLDGWVPTAVVDNTVDTLTKAVSAIEYVVQDPQEGEVPPTLMSNNGLVAPFGGNITAMYGLPNYGAMDPNPFVAFFYILFFGFMLSDAGYGLLMTIACFAYLFIKRPVKDSGSFIKMFGFCGLSTIFWGTIFGSWFGMGATELSTFEVGKFLASLQLIDPLDGDQTLIMFGLGLALGAVQIAVGFILNGVKKIKSNNVFDGILSDFSWAIILAGGGIYILNMLVFSVDIIGSIGMIAALIGVVMLIAGGAVGKKNPIKAVVGALGNLYGAVNVFSDILSYARLFGLGLTTCVIGLVVNEMGMIFIDLIPGVVGIVCAVCVWLGGHVFNIAINTLGVYVHNSRLQYVEFFGKFYEGTGRAFAPLGSQTKYVYLSDSLVIEKNKK